MTTVEVLVEARKLIEKPEAWTRESLARNADGNEVHERSAGAVCFCVIGAILRAAGGFVDGAQARKCFSDANSIEHGDIASWQDLPGRTHSEVLEGFDRAIELAGASV